VPYLFPFPNGTISQGIQAVSDELDHNFIVAGGGANGGSFDHDDGSSFYRDHDNFEVYGGHKSDFDGHAKRSYNNIHAVRRARAQVPHERAPAPPPLTPTPLPRAVLERLRRKVRGHHEPPA